MKKFIASIISLLILFIATFAIVTLVAYMLSWSISSLFEIDFTLGKAYALIALVTTIKLIFESLKFLK